MAILTTSERGVVTLPAKLRKELGIFPGQPLIAEKTPEGLLLRPAVALPIEIYSPDRVREFEAEEARLAAVLSRPKKPAKRRAARKR